MRNESERTAPSRESLIAMDTGSGSPILSGDWRRTEDGCWDRSARCRCWPPCSWSPSLVGLFISNSATAVLIAPVAIDAARALHVSPHAFAITVALGCCAAFVTPVSSAVNMLVVEPGGYTFGDFAKVGLPLLLLTMLVTVALVAVIYPLSGT